MRYVLNFGPEILHVDMDGGLTFMDARAFHRMMSALCARESRSEIRLNLGRLENMDCSGLYLLMQAHDVAKKFHRRLVFVGPKGRVLDLLSRASTCNFLNIAA